jgi:hypothetical protein
VPSRNDPANFAERADATLGALPGVVDGMNALGAFVEQRGTDSDTSARNASASEQQAAASAQAAKASEQDAAASARAAAAAPATPSTSTTRLDVGTGSCTLVTQRGLLWAPGQDIHVAYTADPAGTGMHGVIVSYDPASGQMEFVVGDGMAQGEGSFEEWTITGSGKPTTLRQLGLPDAPDRANRLFAFDGVGDPAVVDFPPANVVTYGGGVGTGDHPVRVGWNSGTARMELRVDDHSFANTWPIDTDGLARGVRSAGSGVEVRLAWSDPGSVPACLYGGNSPTEAMVVPPGRLSVNYANSAGRAVTAGNADNADRVNGLGGWSYSNQNYNPPYLWATAGNGQSQFLVQPGNLSVNWANTSGTASNANALGGQAPGYYVNNAGSAVVNLRNNGSAFLVVGISGWGDVTWSVTGSDERLKENIAPTTQDSLAKIRRIDFKQFNYRKLESGFNIDDGRLHKLGPIAQQLLEIDPEWVHDTSTWLQPDQYYLLVAALHAIQQQSDLIDTLTARVAALESN